MSGSERVVLRYEDDWGELRAQLAADRAAGLSPSAVRECIEAWLGDSFVEVGTLVRRASTSYRGGDVQDEDVTEVPSDGVIAGWGKSGATTVFVVADDVDLGSDVRGGAGAGKATRIRKHALDQLGPLIQVLAARRMEPGAFIGAEFVRFGYGLDLDFERTSASRVLEIGIVTGPLTEQAAYEATTCHIVVLAGPSASLFGHGGQTALDRGLADAVVDDLGQALQVVADALAHLPSSCFDAPCPVPEPAGPAPGDLLDDGWSIELAPSWQQRVRTRLGTIGGHVVGVIQTTSELVVDAPTARKLLRVVQLCESFRLPIVVAHVGFAAVSHPGLDDIDANLLLRARLGSVTTPIIEVASGTRTLDEDLAVRPTWSGGPESSRALDARAPERDVRRLVIEALAALAPSRLRPDQDERVRTTRPRALQ